MELKLNVISLAEELAHADVLVLFPNETKENYSQDAFDFYRSKVDYYTEMAMSVAMSDDEKEIKIKQ